jgi:hypothetical protein
MEQHALLHVLAVAGAAQAKVNTHQVFHAQVAAAHVAVQQLIGILLHQPALQVAIVVLLIHGLIVCVAVMTRVNILYQKHVHQGYARIIQMINHVVAQLLHVLIILYATQTVQLQMLMAMVLMRNALLEHG